MKGGSLLEYVLHAVRDPGIRDRSIRIGPQFDDDEIGLGCHPHIGIGRLAIAGRTAVAYRHTGEMSAMTIDIPAERAVVSTGVDGRLRVLRSIGEARGR